jgi:hypothetical protein
MKFDLAFVLRDCGGDIEKAQRRIDRALASIQDSTKGDESGNVSKQVTQGDSNGSDAGRERQVETPTQRLSQERAREWKLAAETWKRAYNDLVRRLEKVYGKRK